MITSIKEIQQTEQPTIGSTIKMAIGLTLGVAVDIALTMAFGRLIPHGKGFRYFMAKAGTFVLSMMAGEKAEEYVYSAIDDTVNYFAQAKGELLEAGGSQIEVIKVEE